MIQDVCAEVPEFKTTEEELNYWKKEAIFYKEKYFELKLKRQRECDYCEDGKGSKKARIVEVYQDPMEILPEKCKHKILNFFSGKQLLRLTEVSKGWKKEIALMPQLLSQAIGSVKLRIKDEFMEDDWNILLQSNRQYKHLELIDCFEEKGGILSKYSRSLLSLAIKDTANFHRLDTTGCTFPKLRKLCIDHFDSSWTYWLLSSTFPSLRELRYKNQINMRYLPEFSTLIEAISQFLLVNDSIRHLYMRISRIDAIDMEDELELRSIDFGHQLPKSFLICHTYSLTTLRAGCKLRHLSFILENFKQLKTLAIDIITDIESSENEEEDDDDDDEDCKMIRDEPSIEDIPLTRHDKINTLFIQTVSPRMLYKVLKALPKLERLINYDFLSKRDLHFIARTSLRLETLFCRGGFDSYILDEYERIQRSRDPRSNTGIEIILEQFQRWTDDCPIWDDVILKDHVA